MASCARRWGLVAAIVGTLACNPDPAGFGHDGAAMPAAPTGTGTDTGAASSTGPATGTTLGTTAPADDTLAPTSTGDAPTTEGTTASADTADTETTPTELERCVAANLPILDDDATGVSSSIDLALEGTIVEVRVVVRATHYWPGDLVVELRKGDDIVTLIENPDGGFCSGNDVDVVLRDDAATTIDDACLDEDRGDPPSLAGDVLPESPLGPVLGGQPVAGTWRLRVADTAPLLDGTLTEWCLQILYL